MKKLIKIYTLVFTLSITSVQAQGIYFMDFTKVLNQIKKEKKKKELKKKKKKIKKE